jgi:hypothetical protein
MEMKYAIIYHRKYPNHKEDFRYTIYEYKKLKDTGFDFLIDVGEVIFSIADKPWQETLASGRYNYGEEKRFINDNIDDCFKEIIKDIFIREHYK